jgi:hypothetical protein
MEEKRIYVVIAETVQNPVAMKYIAPKHYVLAETPETKTIVQPKGRIGAQIGHVTSKMRMYRLNEMHREWKLAELWRISEEPDTAITTIVLAVPDSYSLEFREYLIRSTGVKVYNFYDQNIEAYGPGGVKTAFCTVPVEKSKLVGAMDYLELWREEDVSTK